mmetsp:Transcript_19952/g.46787  ORF Transcript_19952/g.46787 Transcript_19952/m.46787 type:complete len:308 (-) Transcript_19952:123-1046(-)|eukprot:s3102_g2.t1
MQTAQFVDAADDGIFLHLLRCLGTESVVQLASTSVFLSRRLSDSPSPSLLQRYAEELLRDCSGCAAFSCAVVEAQALTGHGPLDMLRALAAAGAGRQSCEVLGLAFVLATGRERQGAPDLVGLFLDAVVRWELLRLRCPVGQCKARQAVDMLLTALLDINLDTGCNLAGITSEAVQQAEMDLDALVEMHTNALLWRYEAVARRRSAAEFIRARATASRPRSRDSLPSGLAAKTNLDRLEASMSSLDETIRGYDKEGYTLVCPQLVGFKCMRRTELPSGHWWVRLDGPLMGRPALAPASGALALALCA